MNSNIIRQNIVFDNSKININNKGNIYIEKSQKNAVVGTVVNLLINSKKDDRILVLPEGAMINFLTDRMSDNKFYYLIPPNIEIFNEDNIIEELKSDLPKFIVIQPMLYNNFHEKSFGDTFGQKIYNIVKENYEILSVSGNEFYITIYKRTDKE